MLSIGIAVDSRKQWVSFSHFRPVQQDGFCLQEANAHRRSIASDYNRPCAVRSVPMWHDCMALLSACQFRNCKALSYPCGLYFGYPSARIQLHRPNTWMYQPCISSWALMFLFLRTEPIEIETTCLQDSHAMIDWLYPNQCRKWLWVCFLNRGIAPETILCELFFLRRVLLKVITRREVITTFLLMVTTPHVFWELDLLLRIDVLWKHLWRWQFGQVCRVLTPL